MDISLEERQVKNYEYGFHRETPHSAGDKSAVSRSPGGGGGKGAARY